MEIYRVGGSVRDELLGRPSKDLDYVVVGSNHDEMISLGYLQVGKDFPVYLHPETKDEYALARQERLSNGKFEVSTKEVSLEDDLLRRDLTINTIAIDSEGVLIDPYGGCSDLASRTLRPVSEAFMEDPLRILRVARFACTLGGCWKIDPVLIDYAKQMDYSKLPKERVYGEASKAMRSERPSVFFRALDELGVLRVFFPQIWHMKYQNHNNPYHMEGSVFNHTMMVVDKAKTVEGRWAALFHDVGKVPCKAMTGSFHGHSDIQWCDPELQIIEGYGLTRKELQVVRYVMLEHHRWQHFIDGSMSDKKMLKILLGIKDWFFLQYVLDAVYADMLGRYGIKKPLVHTKDWVLFTWGLIRNHKTDCQGLSVEQIKQKVYREKLNLLRELLNESGIR